MPEGRSGKLTDKTQNVYFDPFLLTWSVNFVVSVPRLEHKNPVYKTNTLKPSVRFVYTHTQNITVVHNINMYSCFPRNGCIFFFF